MPMAETAPDLDDLMSEAEVYKRYGHLFIDKELRRREVRHG